MYIIVNGKPTKCKIVWRSLVNVANINAAVCKLKEINWLYGEVDKDSVDDVYKKVIEITNSATSRMLVKASESDVSGFQAFTVRNLDNKLSTDTDIEQYKLLNVREDPISNRQEHLDVMWGFLHCSPLVNLERTTLVRLKYLTVSTINQGY